MHRSHALRRTWLAFLGLGVAAAIMLAEVDLRIQPTSAAEQFGASGADLRSPPRVLDDDVLRPDPMLGWVLAPDLRRNVDGLVVRTNSRGLRADREYAARPDPHVARIAAFGDELTQCTEATQDACWVARLEQVWQGTETLNFGVAGYGLDQSWLRYQRDGRALAPCGVLIGHAVGALDRVTNRFGATVAPDTGIALAKPRFLLNGERLALLPLPGEDMVLSGDTVVQGPTLDGLPLKAVRDETTADWLPLLGAARIPIADESEAATPLVRRAERAYGEDDESFALARRILLELTRRVRADGASPVVMMLPSRSQVLDRPIARRPHAALIDRLAEDGVATLDLTDVLAREARAKGADLIFEGEQYSALGNTTIARYLAYTLPPLLASTCPGAPR